MVERLWLKPEEFGESVGFGRTKVYQWMASGELESVKVGSARRIPIDAAEAFVQRLRDQDDSKVS